MKKKILIVMVVIMTMAALTGCGKKVKCDLCGEVKQCTTREIEGKEIHYCSDCEEEIKSMVTVQNHEQLRSKPMQIRHSAKGLEQSKFTLWYANTQ